MSLTEYWRTHYLHPDLRLCMLCGNTGLIDTRLTAISPAGFHAGAVNFCICPNGRQARKMGTIKQGTSWGKTL